MCRRGSPYVRHAIISTEGGFVIQDNERHNERRDQEAELSSTMCSDVEGETVPQDISREQLKMGANKAQRVNLVILTSGSCEPQRSAFFDVRDSRRVLYVEHETFTPLIFTTIGRMDEECLRYL